jgi:unsaturated rhamnogalacturonyl hydrolase
MAGEDLTSSRFADPPLSPLTADALSPIALAALGERIERRTWADGLPELFWGEGVCLLGMIRFAQAAGLPFPGRVHDWVVDRSKAALVLNHVNNVAPGTAAVLDGSAEGLALAEQLLTWMRAPQSLTRDANGAIEHWPGGVWADTVFMGGLFLGQLGVARGDRTLVAEFGDQWLAHAYILQDEATGLFVHGSHRGEVIRCFWGRANAWMLLSGVEYLEIKAAHPQLANSTTTRQVAERVRRAIDALCRLQPEHGVWSVLVDDQPENAGVLETSAAAGIGAAMLRAARVDPSLPAAVRTAGWRAVAGALAYVNGTGHLTRVSAGTVLQLVPFGYSVIRDDRPQLWGQGLALHAIAAALEADADDLHNSRLLVKRTL